jgi:hypothetical protein
VPTAIAASEVPFSVVLGPPYVTNGEGGAKETHPALMILKQNATIFILFMNLRNTVS